METAVATTTTPHSYDDRVAAALRGYLAQVRLTKKELAARLGQTPFWVGRRLNGQTPISVGELVVIADVLGESVTQFMPDPHALAGWGTASLGAQRTRSSTDRASDYGSETGLFRPARRRSDRRRQRSVVPLHLVADLAEHLVPDPAEGVA